MPNDTALRSASHSYFAVGDHQNLRSEVMSVPLTTWDLRFALNYQALFSQRIFLVAEDMLVNERLMSLLLHEYRDLLTLGIFVPILREEYDDIADCATYLSAGDYYNQAGEEIWKSNLRALNKTKLAKVWFSPEDAYAHFTDMSLSYVRAPLLLEGVGLSIDPLSLENRITAITRAAGREYWRRSAFFTLSDELERSGQPRDARRIRQLSSVLYMSHFGGLFGQVAVFPEWYQSWVRLLAAVPSASESLRQPGHSGALQVLEKNLPHARKDDLAQLDMSDVLTIRGSEQFITFMRVLAASSGRGVSQAGPVITALGDYLEYIDEFMAARQSGLRKRLRAKGAQLALTRTSGAAGAFLSIGDVATGGTWTPGTWPDAALAGAGLTFLLLDRVIQGHVNELHAQRRAFWTDYCGADGSFSAQISGLPRRNLP